MLAYFKGGGGFLDIKPIQQEEDLHVSNVRTRHVDNLTIGSDLAMR